MFTWTKQELSLVKKKNLTKVKFSMVMVTWNDYKNKL